jgi:dienelactone hydrolase
VFRCGSGPPVIILHELNGATPALFRFGWRVANVGFTVYVPILFGHAADDGSFLSGAFRFAELCLSKEFALFAQNRSSPISDWVPAMGRMLQPNTA